MATLSRTVTAGVLVALLAGCAASPNGSNGDLAERLAQARAHPEDRLALEVRCERTLAQKVGDFPYKALFAGLLDVPRSSGGRAFCAALVEAAVAGDLSQEDVAALQLPQELRGAAPAGKLLRALIVAHERLYAQQAQRPPQAQSCGCGQ